MQRPRPARPPCPSPHPARPADIAALREEAEASGLQKRGEPFPYGDEVPPPRRNWAEEGKVTPVKDQ